MIEWILLAVAILLVAASAICVAAEFSLITVDRVSVEQAAEAGDRGAAGVLAALKSLSTQMSGAQLGITVTSLAVGFLTQPSLAALLEGPIGALGADSALATGVSVIVALFIATVFQMIFGELLPKNLAIAYPFPVARAVAPPQRAFTRAAKPLITFLNGSANALLRAMGIEPREELRSARSPAELGSLVRRSAQKGTLTGTTAGLVTRSLAFGDRTAADVMTPRVRVRFIAADAPVQMVIDATRDSGHSRFPVTGPGGSDDVVGMVHIKHALSVTVDDRSTRAIASVMVPPLVTPTNAELDPLLVRLRGHGLQMAVVVDEYGGTDGVVTLEDLVEELVGDIADEHDPGQQRCIAEGDGRWSLDGLLRPDEVTGLTGVAIPEEGDSETLAGLVLDRLGRVPEVGAAHTEQTAEHTITLTVRGMDGRRIDRVELVAVPLPPAVDGDGPEGER